MIGTDGRGLVQVTRGRGSSIMPRWSPDGASLYFFQEDKPAFSRVPVNGGPVTDLIPGWRWGSVVHGAWLDPSGTRIAYTTAREGAPPVARVRDLASGVERDIGPSLSMGPWSPDGTLIAAHAREEVLVCPAEAGPCRVVAKGARARWSGDGRRLFVSRLGEKSFDDPTLAAVDVWSVALDGSDQRRVTTLEPMHVLTTPFEVSIRDEVAWVEFRRGKEELWLAQLDGP